MQRREFLTASAIMGLGLGLGSETNSLAHQPAAAANGRRRIKRRQAKTTKLFKAPGLYPNA